MVFAVGVTSRSAPKSHLSETEPASIMVDRKFALGAAVAVGAVLLVPGVAAALGRAARPLVKAAVKTGMTAYEEFRHASAEAFENMEDIVAEAEAEKNGEDEVAPNDLTGDVERAAQEAQEQARAAAAHP